MKLKKKLWLVWALGWGALLFGPAGDGSTEAQVAPRAGMTVVVFPVRNVTDQVVWGSKYYPGDVLPDKLGDFFRQILKDAPLVEVREGLRDPWLSGERREGDLAVDLEIYRFEPRRKEGFGTSERGIVSLRMVVYDGPTGQERYRTVVNGKSSRWTPEFREKPDDGAMEWRTFEKSSFWIAFQDAARKARDDIFQGYTGYAVMGRLISPMANSTREHPRYILSLGKFDSLKVGDVLAVGRSDTYITVDAENPVVVMPRLVGKVRVDFLKPREAEVSVVEESKDDPIQLRDLVVMPLFTPRKGSW